MYGFYNNDINFNFFPSLIIGIYCITVRCLQQLPLTYRCYMPGMYSTTSTRYAGNGIGFFRTLSHYTLFRRIIGKYRKKSVELCCCCQSDHKDFGMNDVWRTFTWENQINNPPPFPLCCMFYNWLYECLMTRYLLSLDKVSSSLHKQDFGIWCIRWASQSWKRRDFKFIYSQSRVKILFLQLQYIIISAKACITYLFIAKTKPSDFLIFKVAAICFYCLGLFSVFSSSRILPSNRILHDHYISCLRQSAFSFLMSTNLVTRTCIFYWQLGKKSFFNHKKAKVLINSSWRNPCHI